VFGYRCPYWPARSRRHAGACADGLRVASASKQLGEARRGEWATTLRSEHERRGRLALQLPQRPHFIAEEWMRRCLTALSPAHMQWSSIEFETGMKLLDMSDDIRAFIAANEALLKAKD
jgi:hypothetical protein